VNERDELKAVIAAQHGLDREASRLLQGTSIEELEQSAIALAKLLGKDAEPDPVADSPPDLFADAAEMKAARQAALASALTGPSQGRARDAQGRFAATGTGFDGGAREPMPARRSPEAEHGQLIGQMAAISRTFRG
jgi:hypothetical protein